MYIIDEFSANKKIEISLSIDPDFVDYGFDDICFFCLSKSGKIINDSDFVFHNSNCRGDSSSIIPFDKNRFRSRSQWRGSTLPTSEDNAIWIGNWDGFLADEDNLDNRYYIDNGGLYLPKLREEIVEIIVLCSGYYRYGIDFNKERFRKTDFRSIKQYEIPIHLELRKFNDKSILYQKWICIKKTKETRLERFGAELASIKRGENNSFILETFNETELVSLMDLIDNYT